MRTHVLIFLTTDKEPPILLQEVYLNSASGSKPGAALSLGVGMAMTAAVSAATGEMGDKKASVEADAARVAKQVAKEIVTLMMVRRWIPPPMESTAELGFPGSAIGIWESP